MEQITIQ